jgi:hypothetical protein
MKIELNINNPALTLASIGTGMDAIQDMRNSPNTPRAFLGLLQRQWEHLDALRMELDRALVNAKIISPNEK